MAPCLLIPIHLSLLSLLLVPTETTPSTCLARQTMTRTSALKSLKRNVIVNTWSTVIMAVSNHRTNLTYFFYSQLRFLMCPLQPRWSLNNPCVLHVYRGIIFHCSLFTSCHLLLLIISLLIGIFAFFVFVTFHHQLASGA